MINIKLRNFRKNDISNLYDIIVNPKFIHIVLPKSFESYETYFTRKLSKRKHKLEFNYAVLLNDKFIGTGAIKINEERPYIGEITYIIDERFWGKGIGTKVAKLLERISFEKLKLSKTEIWMSTKNLASERIAIKLGYIKEGMLKKKIKERRNKLTNVFIYSKINKN